MKQVIDNLTNILKKNDIIVVATSGGPDSMCLVHLLWKLKDELDLNIIVAHVNHKLRVESEEEKVFVEEYAKEHGLPFEYMEIKEYSHDNLEREAREKRYEFFKKVVKKYHAKYLMTAHHGDDLVETIMMRLVRGSSLKGYGGFKEIALMNNYKIVRPLIRVTKDEILEYMEDNHLKYYVDESNYSLDYTRNRYRMEVLPFLKAENSNVHLKFLKFSQELNEVNLFLDKYIVNTLKEIKDDSKGIDIKKLLKLGDFLAKKVIEYELSLVYGNNLFFVSDKHTEQIFKLIKGDKSNSEINLPNGFVARKIYNRLKIEHNKEWQTFSYILDSDEVKIPSGKIRVIKKSASKSNYVIRLCSEDIKLPIIVRSRKNGDKMAVKKMRGTKKIKDIFIDEKVPMDKREIFPIVTDSENNILWLPGVKKSKFDVESNGICDIILQYEEEK